MLIMLLLFVYLYGFVCVVLLVWVLAGSVAFCLFGCLLLQVFCCTRSLIVFDELFGLRWCLVGLCTCYCYLLSMAAGLCGVWCIAWCLV